MRIIVKIYQGNVAFKCLGAFVEPVTKVIFNKETRFFTFKFWSKGAEVELDCPADDEAVNLITKVVECGIGFYNDKDEIVGAIMVPMETV